jgi:phosphoribosylanthranilate isomerase
VFVKICGTTTEEDALLAVAMGADAVGFIFAPSPRQISPSRVRDIVRRLPPEVLTVGVFRNELPERVVEVVNAAGLRGAQLHGRETPDQAHFVKKRVPILFQAFVAGDPAIRTARDYGADAVLLDSPSPGSGEVFDWRLADGVPDGVRLLMAGGLNPANVREAIASVHPWGVDVVTGVESRPGHKDAVKVREFISAAKGAEPSEHAPVTDGPYDWEEAGS